jgi:hypothetical protein
MWKYKHNQRRARRRILKELTKSSLFTFVGKTVTYLANFTVVQMPVNAAAPMKP